MSAALSDQMARLTSALLRLDEIERLISDLSDRTLQANIQMRVDEGKAILRAAVEGEKQRGAE